MTKYRKFNLEEAKAGKAVCLGDGTPVRIVCFDRLGGFPIIALFEDDPTHEYFISATLTGKPSSMKPEHRIFMAEEEPEAVPDTKEIIKNLLPFLYTMKREGVSGYLVNRKIDAEEILTELVAAIVAEAKKGM